jgi:two-component system sensor histidine kinase/response regulator
MISPFCCCKQNFRSLFCATLFIQYMESLQAPGTRQVKYRSSAFAESFETLRVRSTQLYLQVKFLGYSHTMEDYEQRKLRIFNQINFFQMLAAMLIPLLGMALPGNIPNYEWLTICWPAGVSIAVLALNYFRKYQASLYAYFVLYPLCTCLIYFNGINPGIELHFILFIILSVFFLHDFGFMIFTICFSMMSFYILSVVLQRYTYEVKRDAEVIYWINKAVSLAFIFYGLFLIKKENTVYQFNILTKQKKLAETNSEIEKQKEELASLNTFKNKLFSIISHDLKSPMYALRNLFQNMHQYNMPAEEIKEMVPDVLKDLNYTTSLMENLLQWAKSQMQADVVYPQDIHIGHLIKDVANLLRLQLEAKKISTQVLIKDDVFVCADKDMIHLVIRNLLSNAIKFTPEKGHIEIGFNDLGSFVEIYVHDSGVGISDEALNKIRQQIFYTTTGTSSETGTGLGLMLCNEFLSKNESSLQIESKVGQGSLFSFTLPKVEGHQLKFDGVIKLSTKK